MKAAYATMRDQPEIEALLDELNTRRVAMKLRVRDLCHMSGVSTHAWYQWHNGTRRPRLKTILKIRNALAFHESQKPA